MNKQRLRDLYRVFEIVTNHIPHHGGRSSRYGYVPSQKRRLKKAYHRALVRGATRRRAMTDAAMEVAREI